MFTALAPRIRRHAVFVSDQEAVRPVRRSALPFLFSCALACATAGGCDSKSAPAAPAGGTATAGMAIVGSNFAVTTVSLYDPASAQLTDACVHSGSGSAVLKQPLSGDVTLPTEAQSGGELVLIDRNASVLTFVDPASCDARAQISVSTRGFKANPYDIVTVSPRKAYVTRYETNAAATPDPLDFDEGDDVLVIDPQDTESPVMKRIALTPYASTVSGTTLQARPQGAVFVGGKVYVTLGNMNGTFDVAGPGRVVEIDVATDEVTATIDLPSGMENCVGISQVAATKRLYVSCGGVFGDPDALAASGLVEIDLNPTPPTTAVVVPASALGGLPLNWSYSAVLGDTALIATLGAMDFVTQAVIAPDAFYAVSLKDGAVTKLLEARGAYNFGRAAIDSVRKKVFLPDGDPAMPLVHVFDLSVDPPVSAGTFDANPGGHLAPREVAWY
jgi:hypothetical protein